MSWWRKINGTTSPEATVKEVRRLAEADKRDEAWEAAASLVRAAATDRTAAAALVELACERCFSSDDSADALHAALQCTQRDNDLLLSIQEGLEHARDIDMLNAPAPGHPLFEEAAKAIEAALEQPSNDDERFRLNAALGTASKLRGRVGDATAESALRRCVEARPDDWRMHYDLGLFFKTRGRFAEGMRANQKAAELGGADNDPVRWNLGICATGAGEGAVAHGIWSEMGIKLGELSDGALPIGGFPSCKVRLAERPLADRDAEHDDPGEEETIWIERLSPCHGIIRSVLYLDLGIDYGDVILFDGAPITHHDVQGRQVPVFPHLSTLERHAYQLYNFAATQREGGQVQDLSGDLAADAVVYSHTEQFKMLCRECWRNPGSKHTHSEEESGVAVVRGQIAAPPDMAPTDLLSQLDEAVKATNGDVELFCPGLLEHAGAAERVNAAQERYELLESS
jgi:tetratricopeptide (TPR) repeat protein